jgi:4-amino-4-deoxy-L-arabinose transferase-like glycosyltransferase
MISSNMNRTELRIATKIFAGLVIASCLAFIGIDLFIIFSRMFYPYQLEWMEGVALVQVNRLLAGKALYVPPSIDFVPLIYPPFYFYASAIIAKLIGLGFGALRLVSFLSSVICATIIYLAVKEQTNSKFAAFLGAGIFASTFMLTGQWFDIARTDMLAAALSMLGIYLAREPANNVTLSRSSACASAATERRSHFAGTGERSEEAAKSLKPPKNETLQSLRSFRVMYRDLLSGLIFALAFLTKQSALGVGLAVIVYYLIFNWRRAIRLTLSFGLSITILYGIFWLNSAGWINYYLFTIPAAHAFDFSLGRIISVLISQFASIPIFLIAGLLPIIISPRKLFNDKLYRYYIIMAGALIATGVVGRLNAFSGPNVYVSSYLGVALLIGLEAGWLTEFKIYPALILLEWVLLFAQFSFLIPAYLQTRTIPTQQDRAAGDALVTKIKSYSGDVLLLDNNYLALYAGKTPYFNEMPMSEISGQGNLYPMPQWSELQPQINSLFHAPTTSAVIVDFSLPIKSMISGCRQQPVFYADKIVFEPVAGPPNSRPSLIITCK